MSSPDDAADAADAADAIDDPASGPALGPDGVLVADGTWRGEAILRDGSVLNLRSIRADDTDMLEALYHRCSERTIYYRFFTPPPLPVTLDRLRFLTEVDHDRREAIVATVGADDDVKIVAVGRWDVDADDPATAEVAFLVEDAFQGTGLGTALLDALARRAPAHGIATFVATVLGDNRAMLKVFQRSGYQVTHQVEYGTYAIAFPIRPTADSEAAFEERERSALAAALAPVFEPRAIAVIGASRDPRSLGAMVLRNVIASGFAGRVHPVNPHAGAISAVPALDSVDELPDDVDLAIVCVPAATVPDVLDALGRRGVAAALVVSAGFSDPARLAGLRERAVAHGMRLIGPGSMGVANTDPLVRLDAKVGAVPLRPGGIGLAAQSGALGLGLLDHLHALGAGVSTFVDLGARADLSSNDVLAFWAGHEPTRVVLLYLETFGNPHTFSRLARRVGRRKPVVVAADGQDRPGTAALFRQAGLIRTRDLDEFLGVGLLCSVQPVPRGTRVFVLSNAGGATHVAANACREAGLELAVLSPQSHAALANFGSLQNPLDLPFAASSAAQYEQVLQVVAADPGVDAVLVVHVPGSDADAGGVAESICAAARRAPHVTFVASIVTARQPSGLLRRGRVAVPNFRYPELAARALGHVAGYGEWLRRPAGEREALADDAADALAMRLAEAPAGRLGADAAMALFDAAGIGEVRADDARPFVCTISQDGSFGTVLGLGNGLAAGMIAAEDHRLTPLTDSDADALVRRVLARSGDTPDAVPELAAALAALVLRVGELAVRLDRIAAADLELAWSEGSLGVADVSVHLR